MGRDRLLLPLGIIAATLVGVIGVELRKSVLDEAPAPASRAQPHTAAPPISGSREAPRDHSDQYVAAILARPLFSPDRRPPAVADRNHDAATELARLTGTIVTPGGNSAIFAAPTKGKPVVVGEGGRVGNYIIERIEAGAVRITGPDGQRILHPTFDPSPLPQPVIPAPTLPLPKPVTQPMPLPVVPSGSR